MATPDDRKRWIKVWRHLALTPGRTLGTLQQGSKDEYIVITAAATLIFASGRDYTEAEVNALLGDWLDGPGAMLASDHVAMRRTLIDGGLLRRDGYGRRYGRGAVPNAWQAAIAALDGVDLAAEAQAARTAAAQRRAQRKANWERRSSAAVTGS